MDQNETIRHEGNKLVLEFYVLLFDTAEDKITFTEIYEELKLLCLHVARRITNDQALAEDAVHDAFLAIIKHKDDVFSLPPERRKAFIVTITKNKAIDILRAENKRSSMPFDEIGDTTSVDLDLTESVENKEAFEHLLSCISSLPEKYKTVFELKYVHDKNNTEIAELLYITPKNVSMRINRAKAMLRDIIGKEG